MLDKSCSLKLPQPTQREEYTQKTANLQQKFLNLKLVCIDIAINGPHEL